MDQSAADAPEIVEINQLVERYEASMFTHRLHAEMSEMSGGCAICHHFNPPGQVLKCDECHSVEGASTLKKPGLRGAYHRQCLRCHQDWSHETNCIVCHVKRGDVVEPKAGRIAESHQRKPVPKKVSYETDHDDGPIVTFYHDDHTQRFSLSCASCHVQDNCGRCHDERESSAVDRVDDHGSCLPCHQEAVDDRCELCHDEAERARFDHKDKGWVLNRYHVEISCRSCHTNGYESPQSKRCTACHSNWLDGDFEHSVTGLVLDENHEDQDCGDCHTDERFDQPPNCEECHDEVSFPEDLPGTRLKR